MAVRPGELRLNDAGNCALLILAPSGPPGLGGADVDRGGLGTWLSREPNPRIPSESAYIETLLMSDVSVAIEWTVRTGRLLSLSLKREPTAARGTQTIAEARHAGP